MKNLLFCLLATLLGVSGLMGQSVIIGTGTTTTDGSAADPVERYYDYEHFQMVFTAAELTTAGLPSGAILTGLGFSVSESAASLANYTISMGLTSQATASPYISAGLTTVKPAFTYTPVVQTAGNFDMITFGTTFTWDGTSGIVVNTCTGSNPFTTPYGGLRVTTTTGNMVGYIRTDNTSNCATATSGFATSRPDIMFSYTPGSACSGTPSPGNTISSVNPVCSGTNFTLSLQNTTPGSGVTYQWQTSATGSDPWTNTGTSNPTFTTLQTAATWYRCQVTCSGNTGISTPVLVTMNPLLNCYCSSRASSTADEDIGNVTLGTINNTSTCSTTGGTGSVLNEYSNYTATVPPTNLGRNTTMGFFVSVITCNSNYGNCIAIYIDYNQDGDFTDPGEQAYLSSSSTTGPHTETGNITIPVGATLGNTMMRVICVETSTPSGIAPCGTYSEGETEDYIVNITAAPSCTPPINLLATPYGHQANISWTETGSAIHWDVEWGATPFIPTGIPSISNLSSPSVTLTGLTPSTGYAYVVRAICNGGSSQSIWSTPKTFTTTVSCPAPTAPVASPVTTTGATINWTPSGLEAAWDIEYGPAGFTPGSGTGYTQITGTTTKPFSLTGLSALTAYDFYVRAACGVGDLCSWSPKGSFTTLCGTVSVFPWNEGFEGMGSTVGDKIVPPCWSYQNVAGTSGPVTSNTTTAYCGPHSGTNFIYTRYSNTTWIFTPQMQLSNVSYDFSFYMMNKFPTNPVDFLMDVAYGPTNTSAGMTHVLASGVVCSNSSYTKFTYRFTPSVAGTYCFGIKTTSVTSTPWYISFDDFHLDVSETCPMPVSLTSTNLTPVSATLGWTSSAFAWEYQVVLSGATPGATGTSTTLNPITITGLSSNTTYDFYVRSNCSGVYSSWSDPMTFKTPCSYSALSENFDGVTAPALPDCWSKYTSPSYSYQTVITSTTAPYNSPNCIQLYNSNATLAADAPMLITPYLANLGAGTNRLRFYAKGASTNLSVIVGTMSDPANSATFTPFQTIVGLNTSTYSECIVSFAAYSGSDRYIAFRHPLATTYSYIYLDNVYWETLPACLAPAAPTAANLTSTTALLDWTNGGSESLWNIKYSTSPFDPTTGGTLVSGIGAHPYTLNPSPSGLIPNTTYYWYVQADCGGGSLSTWSDGGSFRTPCSPISAVPWAENFDAMTTIGNNILPECWKAESPSGTPWSSGNEASVEYNDPYSFPNYLYVSWQSFGPGVYKYLITPGITLTQGTSYDFEFRWAGDGFADWTGDVMYNTYQTGTGATALGSSFVTSNSTTYAVWTQVKRSFTPVSTGTYYFIVRVNNTTSVPYYLGFDDFSLGLTSCPHPASLTSTNITATTAALNWTNGGTESSWNIKYGASGFNVLTSGTLITGISAHNPYSLNPSPSGLTPNTTYDWYVQANCGGTLSPWSDRNTFTTPCTPVAVVPWSENFEAMGTLGNNILPLCWRTESQTGTPWSSGNAASVSYNDPCSSPNYVYVSYYPTGTDKFLITPGFTLTGGTAYDLKFNWVGDGLSGWTGDVLYNSFQTSTGATSLGSSFVASGTTTSVTCAQVKRTFTPLSTGTYYFMVRINNSTNTNRYLGFDDFSLDLTPPCTLPSSLTVTEITVSSAKVGWTGATTVDIDYGSEGHSAGSGTIVAGVTDNPKTISGLSDGTSYDVYVRQDCDGGLQSAWYGPFNFTTIQVPVVTPYCETFESGLDHWTKVNGSQQNKWFVGAAAPPYAGSGSAYISDDGGTTNEYTVTSAAVVHLFRDITFSGGSVGGYSVKFWWKGQGESTYDFLKVYLVDCSTSPVAGAVLPDAQLIGTFNLQGSYVQGNITLPASLKGTTKRIVFSWRNDNSLGTQPPVSVDNICIDNICPAPLALNATNIGLTTANLTWIPGGTEGGWEYVYGLPSLPLPSGAGTPASSSTDNQISGLNSSTFYQYYVRANCGSKFSDWAGPFTFSTRCPLATLPQCETFTNSGTMPVCWSYQRTGAINNNHWSLVNTNYAGGSAYEAQAEDSPTEGSTESDQNRMVSPPFSLDAVGAVQVSFKQMLNNYSSGGTNVWIKVQYSYDGINFSDSWVYQGGSANPDIAPQTKSLVIPVTGSHDQMWIAWTLAGNTNNINNWYVDDICISVAPDDVGPASIGISGLISPATLVTPTAVIKNYGSNTETSIPVTMMISGGYTSTKSISSLGAGLTTTVTFDSWTPPSHGTYDVQVCTALGTDMNTTNDCKAQQVIVKDPLKIYGYVAHDPTSTLPLGPAYFYDTSPGTITSLASGTSPNFISAGSWVNGTWYASEFYNNAVTPHTGGGWYKINPITGSMTLVASIGKSFCGLANDNTHHILYGIEYNDDTHANNLYTIEPSTGSATLIGTVATNDYLYDLGYSGDGFLYSVGTNFNHFYKIDPTLVNPPVDLGYCGFDLYGYQDMGYNYISDIMYLAAFNYLNPSNPVSQLMTANLATGASTLVGNFQGSAQILALVIPDCLQPKSLTTANVTTTTADLSWANGGTESSWNIKYGATGFDPSTEGTLISGITAHPYTLNPPLTPNTSYDWYVQSDCGGGSLSGWSGPGSFTTHAANGTLSGTVSSCVSPDPRIEGVTVSLGIYTTTTSISGVYELLDVPAGVYNVSFSKCGYKSNSSWVTIVSGTTTTMNVCLPYDLVSPQDLEASVSLDPGSNENDVHLSWVASSTCNPWSVLGYNIYKDGNKINSSLVTDLFYDDNGLLPGIYAYGVTADYLQGESDPAGPVSVTACGAASLPFCEYFNDGTLPDCWSYQKTGAIITEHWSMVNSAYAGGTAYEARAYDQPYNIGTIETDQDRMVSPPVTVSGISAVQVRFKQMLSDYHQQVAWIKVQYSFDGINFSDAWSRLCGTGVDIPAETKLLIIPCEGQSTIWIAWTLAGDTYALNSWYIDDVCISPACLAPTSLMTTNITPTTAHLNWINGGTETMWNVKYGAPGFNPSTEGTLISGITAHPYTLNPPLTQNTSYDWYIQSDCGSGSLSGWSGPATFRTICPPVTTFPFSESFDGPTFVPDCWTLMQVSGSGNWARSTSGGWPTTLPHSGAGMAYFSSFNFSAGVTSAMITPGLTFPAGEYAVNFWMVRDAGYPFSTDLVNVFYNDSPTMTGATLMGTINRNKTLAPVESGADGWYNYTFYMPPTAGTYYVIFEGVSQFGNNIFVDDICISPGCASPTSLTATSVTTTSVVLDWTNGGAETTWKVKYGAPGFNPSTQGTLVSGITSHPYTLNPPLSPNTSYDWYVQADCGGCSLGGWSGPGTFTTCDVASLPLCESFPTAVLPACWSYQLTGAITTEHWSLVNSANAGGTPFEARAHFWPYYQGTDETDQDRLVSPAISVSGYSDVLVSFKQMLDDYNDHVAWIKVQYSFDGINFSDAWSRLCGTGVPIPAGTNSMIIPTGGHTTMWIAWTLAGDTYAIYNWYVDDICITGCQAPTSLTANPCAISSEIGWTSSASSFDVEYGPQGFTPTGDPTPGYSGVSNPASLNNLDPLIHYDYYVRTQCDGGLFSDWSGPKTFMTTAAFPYYESFNSPGLPDGWSHREENGIVHNHWSVVNTANAGGTAYEARAQSTPHEGDNETDQNRLVSPPICISGIGSLQVNFRQRLFVPFSMMHTEDWIKVQYSFDGINFVDAWSRGGRIGLSIPAGPKSVTIPNIWGHSKIWIAWTIAGHTGYINDWSVDDICIIKPPADFVARQIGVRSVVPPLAEVHPTALLQIFNGSYYAPFTVNMQISDGYYSTKTVYPPTGGFAPGDTVRVFFDPWIAPASKSTLSPSGSYDISLCMDPPLDTIPGNDCMSQQVIIKNPTKIYGYVNNDPSLSLPQGPAYFYDSDPDNIISIGPGGEPHTISAGAWVNGVWVNSEYYNPDTKSIGGGWWRIDPVTGEMTLIAPLGRSFNGLAYDRTHGVLYGVDYNITNSTNDLFTITPTTGAARFIGTVAPDDFLMNLGYSGDGYLYSVGSVEDHLYKIDLNNNLQTEILGACGNDFYGFQGIGYDYSTGLMYLASYYDPAKGGLMTVDLATGKATLVGNFRGNAELTAVTIPYAPDKTLNLSAVFPEGLYAGQGTLNQASDENGIHWPSGAADHITVELHNSAIYSTVEFAVPEVELGTDGTATVTTPGDKNDSYFITVKHRNSVETTSALPADFSGAIISYSFDAQDKAYGDNMGLMIDGVPVIFAGDENQDGIVDAGDLSDIFNLASVAASGYLPEDINGDGLIDSTDLSMTFNNASVAIGIVIP